MQCLESNISINKCNISNVLYTANNSVFCRSVGYLCGLTLPEFFYLACV